MVWTVATVEERKARIARAASGCPTSLLAKAVRVVALLSWISFGVSTIWIEMAATRKMKSRANMPRIPARPGFSRLLVVSSLMLAAVSQPQ